MSVHLKLVLSEELNDAINRAAMESATEKSEVLRKALQLFFAAREGQKQGLTLGLVEPETRQMQTEIVGL